MHYFLGLFDGSLTWLSILIRVAVSVLIGMLIGVEREISNHPAGMKTHALVCLGAAVTTMISAEMCYSLMGNPALDASSKVDMSRIASGVVSGIGFIGAGAIIKSRDGSVVTGITTAATVWISGCMGLAIGMGYFRIVIIAMLAILFTTITMKQLEDKFIKTRGVRFIEVIIYNKSVVLPMIEEYLDRKQIVITSFDCTKVAKTKELIEDDDEDEEPEEIKAKKGQRKYCCRYFLRIPKSVPFNVVMRDIAKIEDVIEVYESTSTSASAKKSTHSQV